MRLSRRICISNCDISAGRPDDESSLPYVFKGEKSKSNRERKIFLNFFCGLEDFLNFLCGR